MFACIHGPALAEDQLEKLIRCAFGFSPVVERTSSDSLLLDARGTGKLFGSPQQLCRRISAEARSCVSPVRTAVSADPDAAFLAARGYETDVVIPVGRESEFLAPLTIRLLAPEAFGLPEPDDPDSITPAGMELWGIRTIGGFANLPNSGLFERLGATGAELQRIARGQRHRPLNPVKLKPGFSRSLDLEHPVALRETLLFSLGSLINQLCAQLAAQSLAARELSVRLTLENAPDYERSIHFASPTRDHKLLFKLADVELEANPPASAVTAIALSIEPVKPRRSQGGLFAPLAPEPEKLDLQLARMAKLVGGGNVGSPEIIDSHRPQAFRMRHFQPGQGRPAPPGEPGLALRIFRPPLKASVRLAAETPVEIAAPGIRGRVLQAAGPWRVSGDWWSGEHWARSEWDIQLQDGSVCRIYQDAADGAWFVEGVYD
jgi:protein ImuB